jgi:hypothetical protein
MSSNVPQFNLAVPALPSAVFSYFNKDLDCIVSWSPHPDLLSGIRNRLIEAVGRLPRRYLMPPIDGELFENLQAAEDRVMGSNTCIGREKQLHQRVWSDLVGVLNFCVIYP